MKQELLAPVGGSLSRSAVAVLSTALLTGSIFLTGFVIWAWLSWARGKPHDSLLLTLVGASAAVLTMVATIAYTTVAFYQLQAIGKQAQLTADAIAAGRATLIEQQRAWILVLSCNRGTISPTHDLTASMHMCNSGPGPAVHLSYELQWECPERKTSGTVVTEAMGVPLAGNTTMVTSFTANLRSDPQLGAGIANGTSKLVVVGRIKYVDQFGISRYTDVRLLSTPSSGFEFALEGNTPH